MMGMGGGLEKIIYEKASQEEQNDAWPKVETFDLNKKNDAT